MKNYQSDRHSDLQSDSASVGPTEFHPDCVYYSTQLNRKENEWSKGQGQKAELSGLMLPCDTNPAGPKQETRDQPHEAYFCQYSLQD